MTNKQKATITGRVVENLLALHPNRTTFTDLEILDAFYSVYPGVIGESAPEYNGYLLWLRPFVELIVQVKNHKDESTNIFVLNAMVEIDSAIHLLLEAQSEIQEQIRNIYQIMLGSQKKRRRKKIQVAETERSGKIPRIALVGVERVGSRRQEIQNRVSGHVDLHIIDSDKTTPEQLASYDWVVIHHWCSRPWWAAAKQVLKGRYVENHRGLSSLVDTILSCVDRSREAV